MNDDDGCSKQEPLQSSTVCAQEGHIKVCLSGT